MESVFQQSRPIRSVLSDLVVPSWSMGERKSVQVWVSREALTTLDGFCITNGLNRAAFFEAACLSLNDLPEPVVGPMVESAHRIQRERSARSQEQD